MKRLFVFAFLLLTGCSGYTEEDIENALEEGYNAGYEVAEEEAQDHIDEAYEDGYEMANEQAEELINDAYDQGYQIGFSDSQSNSFNYNNDLGDISSSSQQILSSLGEPSIEIDGYEWQYMLDFDKKELIQTLADYNGDYLSYGEVDTIIYLIDGYYENGMKYKSVGEVIKEL